MKYYYIIFAINFSLKFSVLEAHLKIPEYLPIKTKKKSLWKYIIKY